jgi:CheY-like chemotaxis protein
MNLSEAIVLLVDDETDLLEIFGSWLEAAGCRVLKAANGADAIDLILRNEVHALVSDIRMPIMDGLTLVRRLYEMNMAIPSIILVSGFGNVERREIHSLGVEKLLEKPLRRRHLLATLEQSLMDRSRLWLSPGERPAAQTAVLHLQSLESLDSCQFRLGRGGCCFPAGRILIEDQPVALSLHFDLEDLTLDAQGQVEWFKPDCTCAGVSFTYLDPSCRSWVIAAIEGRRFRSFIPRCSSETRAVTTPFQPSLLQERADTAKPAVAETAYAGAKAT